jgi:hypothetical protein
VRCLILQKIGYEGVMLEAPLHRFASSLGVLLIYCLVTFVGLHTWSAQRDYSLAFGRWREDGLDTTCWTQISNITKHCM